MADFPNPLVTCICPTTAVRAAWLPKAIECFQRQTYGNRRMLIVTDSFEATTHRDIRISTISGVTGITLGAKRNLACQHATGEIIAHFDDDDWSNPSRLTEQVRRLQSTGLPVTGYSQMKFTDGQRWWRYVGDVNYPLGTSLCYLRSWWTAGNLFPDMQIGSDTVFTCIARAQKQLDVLECRDMMYAGVHPGNTNQRNYGPPSFESIPESEAVCA